MSYVLPSFGLFFVHIATSPGRNDRITSLLTDNMNLKIVSKSGKANLQNQPQREITGKRRCRCLRTG